MSKYRKVPATLLANWNWSCVLVAIVTASAPAQIFEGSAFPDEVGWERVFAGAKGGERRLENGWFIQNIPDEDRDSYRTSIACSRLVGRFFMEWRARTDSPEWLIDEWQVPAIVVAGGNGGTTYHVVFTESAAVLLRDIYIPRVIVPISPGEAHIYRIEVNSDEYIWYIDGVVVDRGIPEAPYPDPNARLSWSTGVLYLGQPPATTQWDYVRAWVLAAPASGDWDDDARITCVDYYFVHDCLTKDGPGIFAGPENNSGPGCRFADFDADADVDLRDVAVFQTRFTANPDPSNFDCH